VYLQTYGIDALPAGLGGNYVQADGNPTFEDVFYEQLTGLAPDTTYQLSFYQAASQQTGFSGATTEQWVVALGTNPLTVNCSGNPCTYSDTGASIATSPLMMNASEGTVPWNFVTVDLTTGSATTELLSFLAWGDNGNTNNLPPIVFLAGVNQANVLTPEPGTMSLFALGLIAIGASVWRMRANVL
jgi:hypothetical protein